MSMRDDATLEALIRARLTARGSFAADELAGAVAEATRLAHDVAALRPRLSPGDAPGGLAAALAPRPRDER